MAGGGGSVRQPRRRPLRATALVLAAAVALAVGALCVCSAEAAFATTRVVLATPSGDGATRERKKEDFSGGIDWRSSRGNDWRSSLGKVGEANLEYHRKKFVEAGGDAAAAVAAGLEGSLGSAPISDSAGAMAAAQPCRVFVYDLPCEFNSCMNYKKFYAYKETRDYNGYGKAMESEVASHLFKTHMFGFANLWYRRMLGHRHRTSDPREADVFFVPFYAGHYAVKERDDSEENTRMSIETSAEAKFLERVYTQMRSETGDALEARAQDHTFVFGRVLGKRNHRWWREFGLLSNSSRPIANWRALVLELFDSARSLPNGVPVPYPTWVHWPAPLHADDPLVPPPWLVSAEAARGGRHRRAVAAFGIHGLAVNLRKALAKQCRAVGPDRCVQLDIHNYHKSMGTIVADLATSRYALMPPGDTYTRKGLFDAITLGAVPVVFHNATIAGYRWHIPNPEAVSVLIDGDAVIKRHVNVFDALDAIPEEECVTVCLSVFHSQAQPRVHALTRLGFPRLSSLLDRYQRKRRAVEVLASSLQVRMPDGGKRLEDRLGFVPADAADVVVDRICAESRQRRGITA